ncbi:MAG: PleD family two-component system response regulator [Pirellulaceae bacterium]
MTEETVAQLEPATETSQPPRSILVVDDDESQVLPLAHRLQKLGYQVLTAYTAAAALDLAANARPDLALLDICLPDQDGLELCSQLADAPQTCGMPIILLSALDRPDIVRRSRAVGGSYYVRKPYDPNVLLTLIQEALGRTSDLNW